MSKKYVFCLLFSSIMFFLAVNAHAWDGQRKGFILGLGLGSGVISFDETEHIWVFDTPTFFKEEVYRTPVIVDVKIGYAPDNFLQVY